MPAARTGDGIEKSRAAPARPGDRGGDPLSGAPKVPKLEQELSAGCALMAMQMAAQAQGFNGIWRSGWFIFDQGINAGLGLAPGDQLVGLPLPWHPMLEAASCAELPMADFVRRF